MTVTDKGPAASKASAGRAAALHQDALVWDMVWPLAPEVGNSYDQLQRFLKAGVNLVSMTLAGDNHNIAGALKFVASARRQVLARGSYLRLIENADDVLKARQEGKLGIAFHFEGTRCFERDLDMVEAFYKLGVRHTLLAFNQSNSAGGGCAEKLDGGLTRFGRSLVREMERVGMLLDLSHTGYRTTLDALEMATRPAIFSHSNADEIAPHFRNLKNDQILACARTGGVIGVSSSSDYLGDYSASPEAIFRHIDYIANLAGPEHVGLGLDIVLDSAALNSYIRARPDEWLQASDPAWPGFRYPSPEDIPLITERMVVAGYSDSHISLILGENFLRVCRQVWL
jgi:membrane dipeptidase